MSTQRTWAQGPFVFWTTRAGIIAYTEEDRGFRTPCHVWKRCISTAGYGRYLAMSRGPVDYAHRHAYAMAKGPIPPGLTIDHLCRVRACVNPDHLEAVTPAGNARRGVRSRLSMDVADGIRAAVEAGERRSDVARRLCLPRATISRIVSGEAWGRP